MTSPTASNIPLTADEAALHDAARAYFANLAATGWIPTLGEAKNVVNLPTDCPSEYVDGAGHPIYAVMYRAVGAADGSGKIVGDENVTQHADGTETDTPGAETGKTIAEAEAEETREETSTLPLDQQPAPLTTATIVATIQQHAPIVETGSLVHTAPAVITQAGGEDYVHVSWLHKLAAWSGHELAEFEAFVKAHAPAPRW